MQENNKEELMNDDDNEKDSLSELRDMANSLRMDSITEPLAETMRIANENKAVTGVSSMLTGFTNSIPFDKIGMGIIKAIEKEREILLSKSTASVIKGISDFNYLVGSSFIEWIKTIDVSPIQSIVKSLNIPELQQQYKELNDTFLEVMYENRWFPYASWTKDRAVLYEVAEILQDTTLDGERTERINEVIFTYYSKEKIEEIVVIWEDIGLPNYTLRIFNEAVNAYYREEYALTVLSLIPFWEGVIADKTHCPNDYHVSGRTRQNLGKLLKSNNVDDAFKSYCNDFIFYDCRNKEGYKDDVPGRHAYSHSWFTSYPNRKAALNAILFTDFLFKLDEIPVEDNEEKENGV